MTIQSNEIKQSDRVQTTKPCLSLYKLLSNYIRSIPSLYMCADNSAGKGGKHLKVSNSLF